MYYWGDNKYLSIAAASILAKVERDKYIVELCEEHPYLKEYGWEKIKRMELNNIEIQLSVWV